MTSEIYGLKDLISIDDAGELRSVTYVDEDNNKQVIANTIDENPMLPEAEDFARVINDPTAKQNHEDYENWRQLSMYVNKLMFNLRQDAHLYFVGEEA